MAEHADRSAQINEYLAKPYTRTLIPDPETHTFTAQIMEFPGCIAEGSNPGDAYEQLEGAAESWIEAALDLGQEIPEPAVSQTPVSGKVLLRLPKSVHRQAIEAAERDGTSLNQFIVAAVAEKLGAANLSNNLIAQVASLINSQQRAGVPNFFDFRGTPAYTSIVPRSNWDRVVCTPPKRLEFDKTVASDGKCSIVLPEQWE